MCPICWELLWGQPMASQAPVDRGEGLGGGNPDKVQIGSLVHSWEASVILAWVRN